MKTELYSVSQEPYSDAYRVYILGDYDAITTVPHRFINPDLAARFYGSLRQVNGVKAELVPLNELQSVSQMLYQQHRSPDERSMKYPYVRICKSEHPKLDAGTILPLYRAQDLTDSLDLSVAEDPQPFWKDKYELKYQVVWNNKNEVYDGRQNLGDGEGGLIDHISKWGLNIPKSMCDEGIWDPQKRDLVKTLYRQITLKLWDAYDTGWIDHYQRRLNRSTSQSEANAYRHQIAQRLEQIEYRKVAYTMGDYPLKTYMPQDMHWPANGVYQTLRSQRAWKSLKQEQEL